MPDPIVVFKERLTQELGAIFLDEIPPPDYSPNSSPIIRFYVSKGDGPKWWIAFRKDILNPFDVEGDVERTVEKFHRQVEWHEKYKEHF